ncbi:unnamed protein product, partial [Phaeothamnion confervicola]
DIRDKGGARTGMRLPGGQQEKKQENQKNRYVAGKDSRTAGKEEQGGRRGENQEKKNWDVWDNKDLPRGTEVQGEQQGDKVHVERTSRGQDIADKRQHRARSAPPGRQHGQEGLTRAEEGYYTMDNNNDQDMSNDVATPADNNDRTTTSWTAKFDVKTRMLLVTIFSRGATGRATITGYLDNGTSRSLLSMAQWDMLVARGAALAQDLRSDVNNHLPPLRNMSGGWQQPQGYANITLTIGDKGPRFNHRVLVLIGLPHPCFIGRDILQKFGAMIWEPSTSSGYTKGIIDFGLSGAAEEEDMDNDVFMGETTEVSEVDNVLVAVEGDIIGYVRLRETIRIPGGTRVAARVHTPALATAKKIKRPQAVVLTATSFLSWKHKGVKLSSEVAVIDGQGDTLVLFDNLGLRDAIIRKGTVVGNATAMLQLGGEKEASKATQAFYDVFMLTDDVEVDEKEDRAPTRREQEERTTSEEQQREPCDDVLNDLPSWLAVALDLSATEKWTDEQRAALKEVLLEQQEAFARDDSDIGCATALPFNIHLREGAKPVQAKPYRYSAEIQRKV